MTGVRLTRAINTSKNHQFHLRKARLHRPFISSALQMVERKHLSISRGEDGDTVTQQATALVDEGRWKLCDSGKGLERSFRFKTFKTTWDWMSEVAAECKEARHHPEWTNVYNRVHVRWTTHSPEGLSTKDTVMAKFCDDAAGRFSELPREGGEGSVGVVDEDWRAQTKGCCGPKGG